MKEKDLDTIAWKHGIPCDSLLLPTRDQRAYNPLEGYIARSRYHGTARGIPPLNGYLINLFNYLEGAPFQLHPKSIAILTTLYVIFQSLYKREPQAHEIRYLYTMRTTRSSSHSIISLEAKSSKVVKGVKSNVGPYKDHWFFVRDQAPCYREFRTGGEWIFVFPSELILL